MGLLYIAAGIYHLVSPETYLRIMPPWLPAHKFLVLLSGITEVLLGLLIIHPFTRTRAAWGIILLLIAVFPANIQMMLNYWRENSPLLWVTVLRLPLQGALLVWAYLYTKKAR